MNYRAWCVRSGSFSRPDYEIYGNSLTDAVVLSYKNIVKDIVPWVNVEDILVLDLRWQSDVFSGKGGAELTAKISHNGVLEEIVTWIASTRGETPSHTIWKKTGNEMKLLRFEKIRA